MPINEDCHCSNLKKKKEVNSPVFLEVKKLLLQLCCKLAGCYWASDAGRVISESHPLQV
jgi:hypothetical protein